MVSAVPAVADEPQVRSLAVEQPEIALRKYITGRYAEVVGVAVAQGSGAVAAAARARVAAAAQVADGLSAARRGTRPQRPAAAPPAPHPPPPPLPPPPPPRHPPPPPPPPQSATASAPTPSTR